MKQATNQIKNRFELEALESRVLLTADLMFASASVASAAHGARGDIHTAVHEVAMADVTVSHEQVAYNSAANLGSMFEGVGGQVLTPESASELSESVVQPSVAVTQSVATESASAATAEATATTVAKTSVHRSAALPAADASTSTNPISAPTVPESGNTMVQQLTETLHGANGPPVASSTSSASSQYFLNPTLKKSSSADGSAGDVASTPTYSINAATVDLNDSVTTQITGYENGTITGSVTLHFGDVSLGGVLTLTNVDVQFNVTASGGHVTAGSTVTITASSASLNLGSAVTTTISTITGSYDVITKKFSLTFGQTHIAFSSFVVIDAAGAAISYDPNTTTSVTVTDGGSPATTATKSVTLLTIGIQDANLFAGLNGPASNPGAVGVSLTHVNVAIALMKSTDGKVYHAVKASAASLNPVGLPAGFDLSVTQVDIQINGSNDANKAVDFTALPGGKLEVPVGSNDTVDFDFDAPFIRVAGTLSIDFTDYIHIEGSFSFVKSGNEVLIDLGTPAFEDATDVTFELGNGSPFFTATGSLSMKFDSSSVTIISATLTIPGVFALGSVVEIDSPSVTVANLTIDKATGEVTGYVDEDGTIFDPTITLSAAGAALFPGGGTITATVSATPGGNGVGIQVAFNLRTFAFRLEIQEFHMAVGTMFTADSSGVIISYDPEDADPHQLLVEIASGDISFDSLGIFGNITNLQIYKDGFHFDSLTVGYTGELAIGSVLKVTDPTITITDFGVTFTGGNASFAATGSITLAAGSLEITVGSAGFTGTDLTITFSLDPAHLGEMLITAGTLEFQFAGKVTIAAEDVIINTAPEDGDAYLEVGTASATLVVGSLTLNGTATNFSIINDGGTAKFHAGSPFSVSFSATPTQLHLPSWLGFHIDLLQLDWDDFEGAPEDFTLTLTAGITSIQGLPGGVVVSGSITNAVIDFGKLQAGEFPIVSIEGFSGSVAGQIFGLNVNAAFVIGLVKFNADGDVVTDDADAVGSTMYVGVAGGAEIVGLGGVQIYLGFSSLGPLTVFLSAQFPLLIEPNSGLAIGGFSGGISFNQTLPAPSDPFALRDPIYQSPADISIEQWEVLLREQTANQYKATGGGEDLTAAYSQPMVIRAGVTIYDAYLSQSAFKIVGDIAIGINPSDLSSITLLLTGTATFGDSMSFKAYMYALLPTSLATTPQITFLLDAPAPTPGGPDIPPIYSVGGTITFGFTDADGTPITPGAIVKNPDGSFVNPPTIAGFYITIDGVAEFSAAGALTARVTGSATLTITTTFVKLDVSGTLTLTYLGEVALAQGSVVLDYTDPEDLKLYGVLRIAAGSGLAKLEDVGLYIQDAAITFQINTTGEEQTVYLPDPGSPHDPDLATPFVIDDQTIFQITLGGTTIGTFARFAYKVSGQNVFYMEGAFDLRINTTGLQMFANVNELTIGPEDAPFVTFHGFGLFIINDDGIAAMISLSLDATDDELGLTLVGNFTLVMNTTGEDVEYDLPSTIPKISVYDLDRNKIGEIDHLTIPRGPPQGLSDANGVFASESAPGPYVVIAGSATLDVLALSFEGYFRFEMSASASGFLVSLVVHMHGEVPGVGADVNVDGAFQLLANGSDVGVVVYLQVAGGVTTTTDYGAGVSLETNFRLAINTTDADVSEIGGIDLPSTVPADSFTLQGSGTLYLNIGGGTGFRISGNILAQTASGTTTISVSGELTATVGGATLLTATANGTLRVINGGLGVAGKLTVTLDVGAAISGTGFSFSGALDLQVNTTGVDQVVPFGAPGDTITISGSPGSGGPAGAYATLHIFGDLIFGSSSTGFMLHGDFYLSVSSLGLAVSMNASFLAKVSGSTIFSMNASGDLLISSSGIAAQITLSFSTGTSFTGTGFAMGGDFVFKLNTTGSPITSINGNAVQLTEGNLLQIKVTNGKLVLGSTDVNSQTAMVMTGGFDLRISSAGLALTASASLSLKVAGTNIFSFTATGALLINASGIAAKIELTVTLGSTTSDFAFGGDLSFTLEVNSTGSFISTINDVTVNLDASTLFKVTITGQLTIASIVNISGSFTLRIGTDGVELTFNATANIFGVVFTINGGAGIYSDGIVINLALGIAGGGSVGSFLSGLITIDAQFVLKINTTGAAHLGVAANEQFILKVHGSSGSGNAKVYIFGFKLEGTLDIKIVGGKFDAAGHLNFDFFGFGDIDITFHFNSDGKYTFTGSLYVQLGSDDWNIHGTLSVRFSNEAPPNFRLHVDGGVTAFGFDFFSIGADVEINGTSVDISVYVSVDFGLFEIGGTVHIHLGSLATVPTPPPPQIASVVGGVLRLNVGADAPTRGVNALANENYTITAGPGVGQVYVYAPGIYGQPILYTGVTSIQMGNPGTSNMTLQIAGDVTLPVTLTSGSGKNQYIMGGGHATITGTTGNDKVLGGTGGVTFHAGTGVSTFIGGRGNNVIYDPAPVNIIQGYQVTDNNGTTFYYYYNHYTLTDAAPASGYTYTLTYQDGTGTYTNQLVGTEFNIKLTTPSTGAATFAISNFSGSVTLDGNGNSGATAAVTFDGNLTLNSSIILQSNGGSVTLVGIPALQLYGGPGDNTLTVNSWSGTSPLLLDGKGGSDLYKVNFVGSGSYTVNVNDSGVSGVDSLIVSATDGADTLNVSAAAISRATETVNYTGLESLTLNTFNGTDVVNITNPAGAITINAGSGNDTFNVNASAQNVTINTGSGINTINVPVMNSLTALLTVNGNGTETLNLTDTADGTPNSGVLGATSLTGFFGAGGSLNFGAVETMNLNLGSGGNTLTIAGRTGVTNINTGTGSDIVNIQATGGTLTINLSTGTHVVNIGSLAPVKGGTLDKVKGTINLTGTGLDILNVDDSGSGKAQTATLKATSLTFFDPVVINFTGFGFLNVWLGQAGDLFAIEDTFTSASLTPVVIVDGNGGDDIFSVLDTHAVATLNGGEGADAMYVFGNSSVLNLNGDAGDDSFFIFASVNQNGTNLDPGAASSNGNQVYSYRVNAPVNINGGSGNDKIYIFATVLNDFITIDGAHVTGAGIDVSFVNCEQLTVAGLGGDDTFYILAITIPTVVLGDGTLPIFPPGVNPPDLSGGAPPAISFNDTFFVPGNGGFTPGKLSVITAELTLSGNEGVDVAYVDNSGDRGNRNFILTATTFSGDGFGTGGSIVYDNTLDDLNITSGPGHDTFTINGTGAGFQTTIDGGSGNDAFIVNAPLTTPIALHGDSSTFVGDTLTVNGTDGADNIVITGFTIDGLGATIAYGTIEFLTINGLNDNDTFTINGDSIPTTINGNDGNDQFIVNANSVPLVLNGEAGNDVFVLGGNTASLVANGGIGNDSFTVNGNSSNNTTLNGDAGDDTFTVNATSSPLALNGGDDNDAFTINAPVAAVVTVNGGAGVTDTLTVNGTAGVDFWLIASSVVSGVGSPVNYSSLDFLVVNGHEADDIFNVRSTSAVTTLNVGTGLHTINIGSLAPDLGGIVDLIQGAVIVNGNGHDILNVDDRGSVTGKSGQLTSTTLTGLGMGAGGITYNGLAMLNLALGSGNDTLVIASTAAAITNVAGNNGADTFNVRSTTGVTNLDGGEGDDAFNLGSLSPAVGGNVNGIAGVLNLIGGVGADSLHVDDTGDSAANVGTLTSTSLTGLGLGGGVNFGTIETVQVDLGSGNDTFNVRSTDVSVTTTLHTGAGANTINVGSTAPAAGSILENVQGALLVVGSGNDTMNVSDGGETAASSGTLTPTTLTGMGLGVAGITFSGLRYLNVTMGSGSDAFTVNEMTNTTLTVIDGGAGVDSATLNFSGNFAAEQLTLLNFEHATLQVVGDFSGILNDAGAMELIVIGGSLTSTGRLNAGSIGTMTVGGDLAGVVTVTGLLNLLTVSGGTPGKIVAGSVNLITVLAGFGNKVLQVIEGGVERQLQTSPLAGGILPATIRFAFVYDSIAAGDPQLAIRVTNPTPATRFDLSLVVYSVAAKFNLSRIEAVGVAGISNLTIEGDLLAKVSAAGLNFLGLPAGSVSGVVLPTDDLAGIAVRDALATARIRVHGLMGLAFAALRSEAGHLSVMFNDISKHSTIITPTGVRAPVTVLLAATETIRVPFGEKASVRLFVDTDGDGDLNQVLLVTDQMVDNASITAFVKVHPGTRPGFESIALVGDGGSVSAVSVMNLTSTGSLGNLTFTGKEGVGNITAPSIFGNISITNGTITGILQTTGIRLDPITGAATQVGADIGRVVNGKATTLVMKLALSGQIISRGNLVSVVQLTGITATGVIAVQGDVGEVKRNAQGNAVTDSAGKVTRYGGIATSSSVSGQIVVLGNVFGDVNLKGTFTGRLAVKGTAVAGLTATRTGILGNVTIANLALGSAVVSGGTIGDAFNKTLFNGGGLKGFLAANGAISVAKGLKIPATSVIANAGALGNLNGPVINAIFTNGLLPLTLDILPGDLQGLALIRTDLGTLGNSGGTLSGTIP